MRTLCLFTVLMLVLLSVKEGFTKNTTLQSSKKGLVIPYWPRHRCGDFQAFSTVSWWYNYHTHNDPRQCNDEGYKWWCKCPEGSVHKCLPDAEDNLHFVPMIQGVPGYGRHPNWSEPHVEEWYYHLLGYNEPNQPDQANIPPEKAAQEWIKLEKEHPDKVLIAPATGHADTEWFDAFWDHCQELGCRIDFLATHMYDGDADIVMSTLEEYSRRYGNKKIWFTEFAKKKTHSEEEIVAFIEDVLPRLEAAPFVFRYSWFVSRYYPDADMTDPWFWLDPINSLLEFESSELTAVGRAYDVPYHLMI